MGSRTKKRKWYALFSHTGGEINRVVMRLGIRPDGIVTTNKNYEGFLPAQLRNRQEVEGFLENSVEPHSVVTLHGYRYLLSRETLEVLYLKHITVVNIHPAPIFMRGAEFLKGLDPHERYYKFYKEFSHAMLGVTLHLVDGGVDTGQVIYGVCKIARQGMSYDEFCSELLSMGTEAWLDVLPELLRLEE